MTIPKRTLFFFAIIPALLLASAVIVRPGQNPSSFRVSVSIDPALRSEPVSGRLLFLVSKSERFSPGVTGTPVFGKNVDDAKPGEPMWIDDSAFGYPLRRLSEIPPGEYYIQAWLNLYTTFRRSDGKVVKLHMDQGEGQNWRRSPGNLYSDPLKVKIEPGMTDSLALVLNRVVAPIAPYKDTANLKHIKIESKLLTAFWGRPMFLAANILLPEGYDDRPHVRYPVHYVQGHFPRGGVQGPRAPTGGSNVPRFIQVTFEHACPYYDDSYGVNSENVGPYGDAIITELIPHIEREFRAVGQPWARTLSGGSTGGWIALALQVFYPDFFGGAWSISPDPVDFRKYQIVNLYDDKNAYFIESDWLKVPRGAARDISGNLRYTMDQECLYEEAIGDRCRSGGQWAIWNAVFAPVAEDGYPKPLWDPRTGLINPEVVQWAGERYDLRRYLEKNWPVLGSKLEGKIRVYNGRMDNFYLNEACYLFQEALEKMTNPAFGGEFRYGDRGGHGWSPFKGDDMLRAMAERIVKSAPDSGKDWIY